MKNLGLIVIVLTLSVFILCLSSCRAEPVETEQEVQTEKEEVTVEEDTVPIEEPVEPRQVFLTEDGTLHFISQEIQYKTSDIYQGQSISQVYNWKDIDVEVFGEHETLLVNATNAEGISSFRPWATEEVTKVVFESPIKFDSGDVSYLFAFCTRLTEIENIDNLSTENITAAVRMFSACEYLPSISLPGFSFRNCINAEGFFEACTAIKEISIPVGCFEKCENADYFFYGDFYLESIYIPEGSFQNVTSANYSFYACQNLKTVSIPASSFEKYEGKATMLDECKKLEAQINITDYKDKISYGTSTQYTKDDMDEAIFRILVEMSSWRDELVNITYTSDSECSEELHSLNSLLDEGEEKYTQCIIFNVTTNSGETSSTSPWVLVQTESSSWTILMFN